MVTYTASLTGVQAHHLHGFFVGWPRPPSPATHLRLLQQSDHAVLAMNEETHQVVGFVTAISDGVLSAYIPFLEVLPAYQARGIGGELVRRMLALLAELYMVDLLCEADLQPFYAHLGMQPATGMIVRRRELQSGAPVHESGAGSATNFQQQCD